jgi:hypothetical protein
VSLYGNQRLPSFLKFDKINMQLSCYTNDDRDGDIIYTIYITCTLSNGAFKSSTFILTINKKPAN